jgi:hypothetical protein
MAIAFTRAKAISRGKGQNSVACAAYRSGQQLYDKTEGKTHDYHKKKGVIDSGITVPEGTPDWMSKRSELWNRVEAQENRKDSQVAREFIVAIPHELADQSVPLTKEIARQLADRGMVVDWAIHAPGKEGDERNYHVHLMTTMRKIEGYGFGDKAREWNTNKVLDEIKAGFAKTFNRELLEKGLEPVDWRSYEAQGITDREPQRHMGVEATAIERRGGKSYKTRYPEKPISPEIVARPEELSALEKKIEIVENLAYFASLDSTEWNNIQGKSKRIEEQILNKSKYEATREFLKASIPVYQEELKRMTKEQKAHNLVKPEVEKRTIFNGKKIDEQEKAFQEWEQKAQKIQKRGNDINAYRKYMEKIDPTNREELRQYAEKEADRNPRFIEFLKERSPQIVNSDPAHQKWREERTAFEQVKQVRDSDEMQKREIRKGLDRKPNDRLL